MNYAYNTGINFNIGRTCAIRIWLEKYLCPFFLREYQGRTTVNKTYFEQIIAEKVHQMFMY